MEITKVPTLLPPVLILPDTQSFVGLTITVLVVFNAIVAEISMTVLVAVTKYVVMKSELVVTIVTTDTEVMIILLVAVVSVTVVGGKVV